MNEAGKYSTDKREMPPVFRLAGLILAGLFFVPITTHPQTLVVDKKAFFVDERPVEMTLVSNLKKLLNQKNKKDYATNILPGTITMCFPDSATITEPVEITARGDFRREECFMPPIRINFKTSGTTALKKLGCLKFVWPCDNSLYNEQLVVKEYLVYKMYNLITEKSFRVRLVKVEYHDINERLKSHKYYGFFIEDTDDMAKRNGCVQMDSLKLHTEQTNREQMTLLALFQYMIGNTDWTVSTYHNIRLVQEKDDQYSLPYAVPYDFDCNGMVNPDYALPSPEFNIVNVRQRLYRGYARKMKELQSAMEVLRAKRQELDSLVMNCKPLTAASKEEMIAYLDEFFTITANEENMVKLFIQNARTN